MASSQQQHLSPWWSAAGLPGIRLEAHFEDRVVPCFVERAGSFYALLERSVERYPDQEALVCGDQRWTWRQLEQQVARVAGGLAALGVCQGDRVALYLSNRPEFVLTLFAVQRLGAVAVPIGTREQREGLVWILSHSGSRVIVLDAELQNRLPVELIPHALEAVLCDPLSGEGALVTPHVIHRFAELLDSHPEAPAAVVDEEDPAVILYTSGTTGRPKGAMLTHLNVVHSVMHYIGCWGLKGQDRSMLCVPASHVTGLIANIATMAGVGGALIVLPEFKASAFLELAARERMSYTLMVPAMYNLILLDPGFDPGRLAAWRIGGYGGAPMPVVTIDALAQRLPALTLLNAYGATETTSPTTLMPPGQTREHLDAVGVALPCAAVMVVDDRGRELPPGEVGEIWISGPMVVRGYWNNHEATENEFTAGWWHSGDLGSVDEQGFVRVFDRKKDMLNRGGYKIFSVEVENTIAQIPGVIESAIVGKSCPVLGERVHVFVYTHDEALDLQAIQTHCAHRLADYKVPESATFTRQSLPRNPNGKLLKRELRARLLADTER